MAGSGRQRQAVTRSGVRAPGLCDRTVRRSLDCRRYTGVAEPVLKRVPLLLLTKGPLLFAKKSIPIISQKGVKRNERMTLEICP